MDHTQQYRRALHRIPELGFELPETIAFVKQVLSPLRCVVTEPSKSAICAYFDAGKPETFAFRADMDALPVTECARTAFSSCHPGQMHACGHDAHTAMLLCFAEYLDAHPEALTRNALLIFEPAEETTGGARGICASGVLEAHKVSAVFGIHLQPGVPLGTIATRAGAMMAMACETNVTFFGTSAHIAKAEEGADAVEAAARFLCAAYDMERTELPPEELRLLKFGKFAGGTVRNALAAEAKLVGSLRGTSEPTCAFLKQRVRAIAAAAADATGCTVAVEFGDGYPPVHNDETLTARVLTALGDKFCFIEAAPAMTAEDFSVFGRYCPSVFFELGIGDVPPLHAATFAFDESVLPTGPALYAALLAI